MHRLTGLLYGNEFLSSLFQGAVFFFFRLERRIMRLVYRCRGVFGGELDGFIPKTIHLCWFGDEAYPVSVLRCLGSWYRHLPEYEIVVWNREMALSLNIPYIEEAIRAGKYAFAADAVRLHAVYTYGGVYMDSDVFIRKRFDGYLIHKTVFFREYYPDRVAEESLMHNLKEDDKWGSEIQAALFASEKGAPVLGEMLDYYRHSHFAPEDALCSNLIVSPQVFARTLERYGLVSDNVAQILPDDIAVFADGPVARNIWSVRDEAFAIHLCAQSWKKTPQVQ